MYSTKKITENIYWVGGSDRRLALFENLFPLTNGVSYNSYMILDEKTALLDTVDSSVTYQFFDNIERVLNGRTLNYLIINHMEPDHCYHIGEIIKRYPEIKVVLNSKAFQMLNQFFKFETPIDPIIVKEGDELNLGQHTLSFYMAPMVHWPEAMVTYEKSNKILFSADAFGSFGALNGNIFNDEIDYKGEYLQESRRYYTNIVGKYGKNVQQLLKKASMLDIQMICPLHGLVWRTDLGFIIEKYQQWSKYESEDQEVLILYASMYGHTENAVNILASSLAETGMKNIHVYDVSKTHYSYLIAETFRCSHLVLASPTYNMEIHPSMKILLQDMKSLNVANKIVALIENGSWAPNSGKCMKTILSEMENMTVISETVTIKSSVKNEDIEMISELAKIIYGSING